jgi:hypothetical protein
MQHLVKEIKPEALEQVEVKHSCILKKEVAMAAVEKIFLN